MADPAITPALPATGLSPFAAICHVFEPLRIDKCERKVYKCSKCFGLFACERGST